MKSTLPILFCIFLLLSGCGKKLGNPSPDFAGKTIQGEDISPAKLKGKIVVYCIWATWCRPCIQEITELNMLAKRYKDDPSVEFIAITDDPLSKIQPFLSRKKFDYKHITDAGDIKKKFYSGMVETIPKHVVVNPEGIVTFEMEGTGAGAFEVLTDEIQKVKEGIQ